MSSMLVHASKGTSVDRLDPRAKISGFGLISVLLFVFNDPRYVGAITVGVVLLAVAAKRTDALLHIKFWLIILPATTFLAWQLYVAGPTTVAHVGPMRFTREGLLYGAAAGLRIASILILGSVFVATVALEELTRGLAALKVPYRFAFVISLTARLMPMLGLMMTTIMEAQTARGMDLHSRNLLLRAKRLLPILVPFLVLNVRRVPELSLALQSRGFTPSGRRSFSTTLRLGSADYTVLSTLATLVLVCLLLRLSGHGAVLPHRL